MSRFVLMYVHNRGRMKKTYFLPLEGGGLRWRWNVEYCTPIPTFPLEGGRGF